MGKSKKRNEYWPKRNVATTERDCMRCRKPFLSEGNWNRICASCKSSRISYGAIKAYSGSEAGSFTVREA